MNKKILDKAVQTYIDSNLNADVAKIALSKSPFEGISSAEIVTQINSKKKSQKKLPTWFKTASIYYPATLSIEQTSSEITAKYKSELAKGDSLIDITGGFGVDDYYFAKKVKNLTHCEINEDLSYIAEYNASVLGTKNINFLPVDGIEYLRSASENFDTIFVDPARRSEIGKVFMLKDCTPDVAANLDMLLKKANRIIVKTAPLLDIKAGFSELKNVSEVHIVSLKNECKELLWVIDRDFNGITKFVAVTLNDAEKQFVFQQDETDVNADYANDISDSDYLYEPDTALLKSGAFNLIGSKYGLKKLHPQTQLYTSAIFKPEFAGRIFKIDEIISTGVLKKSTDLTGNIIVRNYPAKPEDLSKKHKIKPGKNQFVIFTKDNMGNNIVLKTTILQYY
ncbi:hypothetical protein EA772_19375 [Pedobacter sp. G11]|uniref:class I SAM-dependent methyltransferase n=1 Tax=Pedobacter sp. G11 TaxID=2482728 RepID=UPI000F5F3BFD|nr:hypothetical protein [Pedobacter sp. G11]AZI27393.1 hypothetical protein EA772_19375 [Pedobacter sp. G11]